MDLNHKFEIRTASLAKPAKALSLSQTVANIMCFFLVTIQLTKSTCLISFVFSFVIFVPFFKYVIVTSPCKSSQISSVTVVLPASYILHSLCVRNAPHPPVSPEKNSAQSKFYLSYDMGVSLNGGTPISHPKMIIFSRKTNGCWGNPPI